ncbi:MAG: ankyrin repeat domain-containing protein [Williamsia sp.]|nr:ankyrin repeat domain-containing protein [Williamsia sp.]
MKLFFLAALTLATFGLRAQKNTLLDPAFWRENPSVEAIRAEISKGSNPAESNAMGFDPVVYAINAKASNEAIKLLLEQKGNDVNKITHDGRTYVFWAANRGNIDIVEYLVSKGAKVNGEDSHGSTPLGFAAAAGQANTKIFDVLIGAGADVKQKNADGANLLLLSIANDKDLSLTNYFISKGLSLNATDAAGNTAFNYAARSGNIELMKTLVLKGVKYNGNAMVMATQAGRGGNANGLEVYQYLESLGIKATSVNQNGENALHNLVRRPNQGAIIQYFLSKGADVNQPDQEGNTPFMNAASFNRDTATMALLLPQVKDINGTNKKGVSALALAVRSNSADMVSYLIRKGADLNVQDKAGNNLAYYLIQSYNPQGGERGGERQQPNAPARGDEFGAKIAVLQRSGYNLATPQKDGNTLYHLAVVKNDLALLKQIEKLNVDVNARNAEGLTALHKAAMVAKDDAVLKYLLSLGAKKDVTTGYKETAFDLARENENFSRQKLSIDFLK